MPTAPWLSILIATFNRANDLDRCVSSVLAEPEDFFEVIIGDDASPDHTPQIVAKYQQDSRVRCYRNQVNLGMQENYWKIVHLARGEYIFILTDDDYLLPGAFERVARVIRAHPEVGYILSHLPSMDERTRQVVDLHRTFSDDILVQPSIAAMTRLVRSAWVLSRQVLKRELIDWETWEHFKRNIFFPIIWTGRLLLRAPMYYIADTLVMHTFFNKVYWNAFGPNELEIEFNLAADRYQCMRAILHDYSRTPEVNHAISVWQTNSLKSYLYAPHSGFYDLLKTRGIRYGARKLLDSCELDRPQRGELLLFPFKIPFVRALVNAKQLVRRFAPSIVTKVRSFQSRTR